ncbi:hypothetical protein AVEN_181511-1 [Araneus ventricosus]|uniref:Uncharacterized protein n=1 Tax=Araneus ventricosus TaxID=182803 RepID=A0A4Y2F1K0_ARAVE|nr:hypothetical protein AVEN_181511-1 [Araneus ventricosus]
MKGFPADLHALYILLRRWSRWEVTNKLEPCDQHENMKPHSAIVAVRAVRYFNSPPGTSRSPDLSQIKEPVGGMKFVRGSSRCDSAVDVQDGHFADHQGDITMPIAPSPELVISGCRTSQIQMTELVLQLITI